jgi:hypothetical protein
MYSSSYNGLIGNKINVRQQLRSRINNIFEISSVNSDAKDANWLLKKWPRKKRQLRHRKGRSEIVAVNAMEVYEEVEE